jgi:CcmD family protein
MATLIATYVVAWVGIGAYAAQLIVGNRRLVRRLGELQAFAKPSSDDVSRVQNAA